MPRLDTQQRAALRILPDDWTPTAALLGRSAVYDSMGSLGRILGQLAAAGLVERRSNGKRSEWRLTGAGREVR